MKFNHLIIYIFTKIRTNNMKSALIVLKIQNDYCDDCKYPYTNCLNIIPLVNKYKGLFDMVIFVKDWHSKFHKSFKENGGDDVTHCVQDSDGAELNPGLIVESTDYIVHIGTLELYNSDSGFYNARSIKKESSLNKLLRSNDITNIYLCGITVEKSIFSTAIDSISQNYSSYVIKDMCAYINSDRAIESLNYLEKIGVKVIMSNNIPS